MHILNILKESVKPAGRTNYKGGVLELADVFGAKNLGFHVETLDPKNFSCPYHYHEKEEELFLVLEGEAIIRKNNEYQKVGPGDIIFYEVGETSAHNMYNFTDKPFKILCISNNSDTDVCHYPDSKKRNESGKVTQDGINVDYFKDEEDPAKYWPAHILRGEI